MLFLNTHCLHCSQWGSKKHIYERGDEYKIVEFQSMFRILLPIFFKLL